MDSQVIRATFDGAVPRTVIRVAPVITAKLWSPGELPRVVQLDTVPMLSDGVLVLTVDATLGDAEEVLRLLPRICRDQLTREMVDDLLCTDDLPEVKQYGKDGHIRKVSSFGVRPLAPERGGDSGLMFEPIEFLAGNGWLIYHWQPCKAYRLGQASPSDVESLSRDDIETEVAKRWVDQRTETSGDLGVLFLYELALQYAKARRALWARLNAWERDFYNLKPGSDPIEFVEPLTELHRLHGELYHRLDGLNIPWDRPDSGWFEDMRRRDTAESVDELIDRSLRNLRSFTESLRQAVSLTQSYSTLRHFELAEEQKKATEGLSHRVEIGAAVLLVPSLIAGVYGANTLLPGGGHWSGFIAMVTLMVLGSGAAYFLLERGRARRSR